MQYIPTENPAYLCRSTEQPSVADLMDTIRDNAQNLSDAIKAANKAGIAVSIEKAPEGSASLIQIIYAV